MTRFFQTSYKSAIETNIVMHKTSQVESSSILLMKPNLRIELYIYIYIILVQNSLGLFCAMIEITLTIALS